MIGIFFFSNWEKSHLNPIGKRAEFRPLRTPKKIPGYIENYGIKLWRPLSNNILWAEMVIGRNEYGPKWSWTEMVKGRNDPEPLHNMSSDLRK